MTRAGKQACVAFLLLVWAPTPAESASLTPRPSADTAAIPGRYIVLYKSSAESVRTETNARERALGFDSEFRYRNALEGFAGALDRRQVRALRNDPDVAAVTPDRTLHASSLVPAAAGESVPLGVRRIRAGTPSMVEHASGIGVAVLDTGVDLTHPDLNVSHGTNCVTPGASADDDGGHGTHVAGTIAAKNNGAGIAGVAPGTKIWAVKVLDAAGDGSVASIICGLDWVTANAASKKIEVLNMSLGGPGDPVEPCNTTADPLHRAVCTVTGAGVLSVVAAGNSGWDFDYPPVPEVPAAYPEVLTVTAMSDSDGKGGGVGDAPGCESTEADDSAATFSNFAAADGGAHTIAAPGVCILSTWPTSLSPSGYATASGTSMAAPHAAGIAALCENHGGHSGLCAGKPVRDVIKELRYNAEILTRMGGYGFEYDPLHTSFSFYFGYLTGVSDSDPPETSIDAGPSGVTRSTEANFSFYSNEIYPAFRFDCSLDGTGWRPCSAHEQLSGLAEGHHVMAVRAVDPSGNADPSPETRAWAVDTSAPDTAIDAGPEQATNSRTATFAFSSTEPASRLICKLDRGGWTECASPWTMRRLSEGSHNLSVVAVDAAGNRDPSPARHAWAVVPGVARIESRLAADLDHIAHRLRRLGIAKLVKRRHFVATGITAMIRGRFAVTLRGTPKGRASGVRRRVLAKGSRTAAQAGRYEMKVKLTRKGRRLLRGDERATVRLRIKFRDPLGRTTTTARPLTLRR